MDATLPEFLRFRSARDLVRVGKDYDGGYLVSKSDIYASDALIGLGIKDDWSFEEQFCSYNDVPVVAYDASISESFFLQEISRSLSHVKRPSKFLRAVQTYFGYRRFFRGSRKHVRKFVGVDLSDRYCSMADVFAAIKSDKVFLKIDIEGAEYRILEELLRNQDRISGLVMELHDCDLHVERIRLFVERFALRLVHVHANNYCPVCAESGMPFALELTFSKHAELEDDCTLPHKLDLPNTPYTDDIILKFRGASG